MVSSAWFYSSIAQAAAAIIGLTIAFTISTHLSRRERRRRRTDEARKSAVELKKKYQPLLDTISEIFQENADLSPDSARYELDDVESVKSWASDQEKPLSAKIWALASGMSNIMSEYSQLSGEVSQEQISTLHEAVQELEYSILFRDQGPDKRLYTEITGQSPEEADGHYYFDDVLEENGRIASWLERHRRAREENLIAISPEELTGKNILSLGAIMEILDADLTEFGVDAVESDITSDFLETEYAGYVLQTSIRLAICGVFFPILFLVSSPDAALPKFLVKAIPRIVFDVVNLGHSILNLLAQAAILAFSTFYTLRLFTIMTLDMRTTVPTMSDLLGTTEDTNSANKSDQGSSNDYLPKTKRKLHKFLIRLQYWSLPEELRDKIRLDDAE